MTKEQELIKLLIDELGLDVRTENNNNRPRFFLKVIDEGVQILPKEAIEYTSLLSKIKRMDR